jgi:hypothetical protein
VCQQVGIRQILTLHRRTDSAARRGGKGQGKACASVARIQRQHAAARQDRTQRRKACRRCKVSSVRICTFVLHTLHLQRRKACCRCKVCKVCSVRICTFVPVFCTSEALKEERKRIRITFPPAFSVCNICAFARLKRRIEKKRARKKNECSISPFFPRAFCVRYLCVAYFEMEEYVHIRNIYL